MIKNFFNYFNSYIYPEENDLVFYGSITSECLVFEKTTAGLEHDSDLHPGKEKSGRIQTVLFGKTEL